MTLNQSTADARDLEARLLVRWLGWKWMRVRSRNLCMLRPPNEGSEWEPSPKWVGGAEREAEFLEPLTEVPGADQRFADWEASGAVRRPKDGRAEYGMPRLSESLDACAMLKAAMLAKGIGIDVLAFPNFNAIREDGMKADGIVILAKVRDHLEDITLGVYSDIVPIYSASDEALAVCRAADAIPAGWEVKP